MRLCAVTSCLILALLGAAQARAQSRPSTAEATESALSLELELDRGSPKLDAEAIRRAVELELKRPVALLDRAAPGAGTQLTVVVHANRTVSVSYADGAGTTRTRTIALPQEAARAAEVVALLAGNLSRDEAAELLALLASRRSAPEAAEPPTAEPAPAPTEPPRPQSPVPATAPLTTVETPAQLHAAALERSFPQPKPAFNLSFFAPLALYPHSNRLRLIGELGLLFSHVGELRGVGINALVLRTERDVVGASIASVYNASGGSLQGAAASGVFNSARAVRGVQVAGVSNFAGSVHGLQVAGVSNTTHELHGVQIGLVNIAEDVDGAQLGLVNIAKHVHGTAVGLVSIAGNGRVQPVFWGSTLTLLNAAAKFTVGPLYTQVGLGYAPSDRTYDWELGLGAHVSSGGYFLEPGVHYSEVRSGKQPFDHELLERLHYRVVAGADLGAASPFVGAALVQRFARASDAPASSAVTVEGLAGLAFF